MKIYKSSSAIVGATALLLITSCATPSAIISSGNQPDTSKATTQRASLEGQWDYTMSNPEQSPFSGVIMVQRGGSVGYTGWISVSNIDYEAQTDITKADIQGDKFTYAGEVRTRVGSYPFELTGTIKGNKMDGQNKVKTEDGPVIFKVTATRK